MTNSSHLGVKQAALDYLVSGLRISIDSDSLTPGPRSHIVSVIGALSDLGVDTRLYVASRYPGLRGFARIPEGATSDAKWLTLVIGDTLRLAVAAWSGLCTFVRSLGRSPGIIYERAAAMQSLTSFHAAKRSAIRIVECNGLMALETARDRNALALERVAAAIERHVYRRADLVIAVSEQLAESVSYFAGVPMNRILVVPNAIPRGMETLEIQPEKHVVGFVGSLVPWQRVDLLLEGLARASTFAWRAEIVGDGPERDRLEQHAMTLGIAERVSFLGRLDQASAYAAMATWSIGYAGHGESSGHSMYHSPLKLYEYAGLGLTVVASTSADALALSRDGLSVHFFEDRPTLGTALEAAFMDDWDRVTRNQIRARLAKKHSWVARVRSILDAADSAKQKST